MHRIVDLEPTLKDKDSEGLIFTVAVGGERFGFSSEEVAELLRARVAVPGKSAGKKGGKARTQFASDAASDTQSDGEGGSNDLDAGERLDMNGHAAAQN